MTERTPATLFKRIKLGFAVVLAFLLGLAVGAFLVPPSSPPAIALYKPLSSYAPVEINATLPKVPTEMYLLEFAWKNVSRDEALTIAADVFNVTGKIGLNKGVWVISPGRFPVVSIYQNGFAITYGKYYTSGLGRAHPPDRFPSDESARAIADKFIEKLRGKGLIPKSLSLSFTDVGPRDVLTRDSQILSTSICVGYDVLYDGVRLWQGASVDIGIGGEIVGFSCLFTDVKPTVLKSILSPTQAIDKLGQIFFEERKYKIPNKVIINGIDLFYEPAPTTRTWKNYVIIPKYRIGVSLINLDTHSETHTVKVCAIPGYTDL